MRKTRAGSHNVKTRVEREKYARAVRASVEEDTLPYAGEGTLRDDDKYLSDKDKSYYGPKQKNKTNRIIFHAKEHWHDYLISFIGVMALYFFVTFNVRTAEMSKDIFYIREQINDSTKKIERVSDEVWNIKSDIQSLTDRFMLLLNLSRQSDTLVEKKTPP
jgi:hypothetical protein